MPFPSQADLRALLNELVASDEDRFPNLKRQQEIQRHARLRAQQGRQAQATSAPGGHQSAGVQQALSQARAQLDQENKMRALRDRQKGKLQRSATEPALERKQSKLGQVVGGLFTGLDVRARSWEAKSEELLNLQRAKEDLQRKQNKDAEDIRALEALVKDIRLSGGQDTDLVGLLSASIDRKTSAEETRKKLESLRAGKKLKDEEKMSLAEQERLAHIEFEAQRLTVIKLQLARREETRKELAAMQEKLKSLNVQARIVTDIPEEDEHNPHGEDDYGLFHEDDDLFGEDDDFGPDARAMHLQRQQQQRSGFPGMPGRAATMDGRSRRATGPLHDDQSMFGVGEELFGEPAHGLDYNAGSFPGQSRRGRGEQDLFSTAGPSYFNDDTPFRRGTTGSMPRQDPRQQLRRAQTMGAYDAGSFPTHRSDPRLNSKSPYYDQRLALAFLEREEKQRNAALLAKRQEPEKLAGKDLQRQQNIGQLQRNHELDQAQRASGNRQKLNEANARTDIDEAQQHADNRKRREELERLERIVAKEEELNRLEKLLRENPQAAFKGLDMQRLENDPQLLDQVLQKVEANIRRGVSPLADSSSSKPAQRRAPVVDQNTQHIAQGFLQLNYAEQQNYLNHLQNQEQRKHFMQTALSVAPQDYAHQLYDRFRNAPYELDMPAGYQPRAGSSRTPVPDIIIDRVRSPPPEHDTGPQIIERYVDEVAAQQVRQQQQGGGKKNKGKGKDNGQFSNPRGSASAGMQPSGAVIEEPPSRYHTVTPSILPSPPRTPIPRMSAGHPSGQAPQNTESALEGEEAAIEREKREMAELEAKIAAEKIKRQAREEEAQRARMEARAAAEAEEASRRAREAAIVLPPPPAPFHAKSPPVNRTASPGGSAVLTARQSVPLPDVGAITTDNDGWGSPAKADDGAWGQTASAPADDAWGSEEQPATASGEGAWDDDELVASPKSASKASKDKSKTPTPATTPRAASPWGSKAATPVASKAASPVASPITSKVTSPAAKAVSEKAVSPVASPRISTRNATPVNIPKVATPVATPKAASVKSATPAQSPMAASVKSASKRISRVASPIVAPPTTVEEVAETAAPDDSWGIPVADDPAAIAAAIRSPSKGSSRARSEKAPTAPSTPRAATPALSLHSTPKASDVASPAKSAKASTSNWGSPEAPAAPATPKAATPAPSHHSTPKVATVASPAKSAKAAASTWGSPPAPPSVIKSPEAAPSAAWGSPAKSSKSQQAPSPAKGAWGANSPIAVASPTRSTQGDTWGASSSPVVTSPARSSKDDTWGASSPVAAASPTKSSKGDGWGAASPTKEQAGSSPVTSPIKALTESPVKEDGAGAWGASSPTKASPAFGLAVSPKDTSATGGDGWGEDKEHQRTATKGSDPVVVSLAAAAATPAPEQHPEEHHMGHHDEEDEEFDIDDFPIFMAGDALDSGMELVMDPPPQPFRQVASRDNPDVNEDTVILHVASLAHRHDFDILFQCQALTTDKEVVVQGYMAYWQEAIHEPQAENSAQWAVSSPPPAAGQKATPSKQTTVKDSSEAGWD